MTRKAVETDLLVIGGGGAGTRAALEAHDAGLDVTLVVKGFVGKSGCSIFAGNLNWFAPPDDGSVPPSESVRVKRTLDFLARYTHYLGDQHYMKAAADYNLSEFFPWLERRGLYMLRRPDGTIVSDLPRKTQAWATKMGLSGQIIMNLMRREIFARKLRVLEETSATRLLIEGDRIAGATAIDYRNGEFLVIRAKAVVLATGHSNYLSTRATGTREGAANGWVMAYRAGVPLQNLEMQWYHASDVARPKAWMRLHLYPNPLPDTTHRTQFFNASGELFYDGNMFSENPVPYIMQLKLLAKQVKAGKARFDGGYYTSYRHVEPHVLDRYISQTAFLRKLGLDPKRDLVENAITWHMNVGGVKVDGRTMESGIDGLYVAGSVSALVTGGLPNVTYDGIVAGRGAVEYCRRVASPKLDEGQVEAEARRVFGYRRDTPRQGLTPAQVKKLIRAVMWEHMSYVKSAASMHRAVDQLARLRVEALARMRLESLGHRYSYDWVEAIDAEDMIDACALVARFSLYRQESRGPFYREDFPYTDNGAWLRHVIGRESRGELELATAPVELPYAQPAESGRADFFSVDY
ncbi:MAG: FAD-binding protein [Pseudomonadota bacterium]